MRRAMPRIVAPPVGRPFHDACEDERMSQTVLILMSIATGLFFAAWPLRMNQSGLPSAAALFTYACVSMVGPLRGPSSCLPVPGPTCAARALVIGVQAGVLNVIGVLIVHRDAGGRQPQ